MAHDLTQFLSGAICLGHLVIAMLFLRFWNKNGDRLFAWFFVAFLVLAAERVIQFWAVAEHNEPLVYVTRLVAFGLIIVGVVDRNRQRGP